ncbi:hypothetical protein GF323_02345 [Candidatus Woesearchaeota archaeon]|nr:hypothetical protein [Candidatus Woesearchaeota archaeon]
MENMHMKGDYIVLEISPKAYSLESVYAAAYVFLDRAYVILDGDAKNRIIVKLKPKSKESPKQLGHQFFNELINYSDYIKRAKETKKVRETLLQRALITNNPNVIDFSDLFFEDKPDSLDNTEPLEKEEKNAGKDKDNP